MYAPLLCDVHIYIIFLFTVIHTHIKSKQKRIAITLLAGGVSARNVAASVMLRSGL